MTTQTHTVSTDALATLGTIIDETAGRDAIHLAVEPVEAGENLRPGVHVGRDTDGRWTRRKREAAVGIVDPFLDTAVREGQRFWLVIYPRQITALRHVWEHPAFAPPMAVPHLSEQEISEQWLREYAAKIDEGFGTLLKAADDWVQRGKWFFGTRTGDYSGKFEGESTHPDFWRHYQVFRGVNVPTGKQHSFFTCSC